jgi:multidrug efflux pump subunit AcrA (membrane-fusion protein)
MKLIIPFIAVLGLGFALVSAQVIQPEPPKRKPTWTPNQPSSDMPRIAGVGIVEPPGEMIAIGSPHAGIVSEVPVQVGSCLEAGDILFRLDDDELRAEWAIKKSELAIAEAKLARLQNLPRPETVPPAEQRLASAHAALMGCEDRLQRANQLSSANAIAAEALFARRNEHAKAVADRAVAEAELTLLKAGASNEEIEVAKAEVANAAAVCRRVETQLDKMILRAPCAGIVLRLNVRQGEAIETGRLQDPLVQFGRSGAFHVRTEFDESNASMISKTMASDSLIIEGWTRGRSAARFTLKLDHWEPYVRPKKSLTGNSSERVDTRVLVAVFEVVNMEGAPSTAEPHSLTIGQQMDVFVSTGPKDRQGSTP